MSYAACSGTSQKVLFIHSWYLSHWVAQSVYLSPSPYIRSLQTEKRANQKMMNLLQRTTQCKGLCLIYYWGTLQNTWESVLFTKLENPNLCHLAISSNSTVNGCPGFYLAWWCTADCSWRCKVCRAVRWQPPIGIPGLTYLNLNAVTQILDVFWLQKNTPGLFLEEASQYPWQNTVSKHTALTFPSK